MSSVTQIIAPSDLPTNTSLPALLAYYHFLKRNFEPVFFGFLLTFFSSFGQTFLISLFVPFILADLAFSNTAFGAYYAGATVLSSILLLRFGHMLDDRPVRPFTIKSVLLLAAACLLLAATWHPAVLFFALLGLRFGGQGLLSHISITTMSRYFSRDRGKALSLSTLGFSVGEMIFPLMLAAIVTAAGWRVAAVSGAVILLSFIIGMMWMRIERLDYVPGFGRIGKVLQQKADYGLTGSAEMNNETGSPNASGSKPPKFQSKRAYYFQLLGESRFYILALPSFFLSFTVTGFFFYQYLMAEVRGWPIAVYTSIFAAYGLVRLIFSLYGGILTDRYRTEMLYLLHLLPMGVGIGSLMFLPGIEAAPVFLFGIAISTGIGMVVKNAIVAEVYSPTRLAQVRSLYTMIMVFSTALAPLLFGWLLDQGVSFEHIAGGTVVALLLVTLHTLRIFTVRADQ